MSDYQCPLGKRQPKDPLSDNDIRKWARLAYHQKNIALIWIDDIPDDWTRQIIKNEADRIYGKS